MHIDKLPLPRNRSMLMALHAYTALDQFREGTGTLAEWRSLAEAFNLVNALARLQRLKTPLKLGESYVGLRDARFDAGVVCIDASCLPTLKDIVGAYDACLQSMARRTIWEALNVIDRCVAEQAEVLDAAAWSDIASIPPMMTEPEMDVLPGVRSQT